MAFGGLGNIVIKIILFFFHFLGLRKKIKICICHFNHMRVYLRWRRLLQWQQFFLSFSEPRTEILGDQELFVDYASSLNLTCLVISPNPPAFVFWKLSEKVRNVPLLTELPGTAAWFFYHWGRQLKSQQNEGICGSTERSPECNADSSIGSWGCKQIGLQGRVWGRYRTLFTNTNNYKTLW